MDQRIEEGIAFVKGAQLVTKIDKGFSADEKYVMDDRFLLRLFSSDHEQTRRKEFNTINELTAYSAYVPRGIEFGSIKGLTMSYMILSYLPGEDAEVGLNGLTNEEQYAAGYLAGKELKKLHMFEAPSDIPAWYDQKKKKSDNYLNELKEIEMDEKIKRMLEYYIINNEYLLKDRPSTFLHDDFHPSNLLIHNKRFSGIIDFQRMDWGDSIHDLTKLGFFSVQTSVEFSCGIVDGYHDGSNVPHSFWELYTLYSAMHIVSSLVWGKRHSSTIFKKMLRYSLNVLHDHNNFKEIIPKWYQRR